MGGDTPRGEEGPPTHPAIAAETSRARWRVALTALLVAGPVLGWSAVTTLTSGPGAQVRQLDGVRVPAAEDALVLRWEAAGCEEVAAGPTDVREYPDEVMVTLRVVPVDGGGDDDPVCQQGPRRHRVTLSEPLGDRTVYDGACAIARQVQEDEDCSLTVRVERGRGDAGR